MLKCPFCHFENEDGALFCEQCKSDLAGAEMPAAAVPTVESAASEPASVDAVQYIAEAAPVVEGFMSEAVPVAAVAEAAADASPLGVPVAEFTPTSAPPPPALSVPSDASAPTVPEPAAPTMPASTMPAPATPDAAASDQATLPPDAQPRLLVLRGQKRNVEYPLYDGLNFIGRADEKPVDIDLEDQEPPDRIWCSRQHALISLEEGRLAIEDLNSSNGTFVNRSRIYPGQKRPLTVNDVIQIGNVQLKVIV
jgi:hypothetical protein